MILSFTGVRTWLASRDVVAMYRLDGRTRLPYPAIVEFELNSSCTRRCEFCALTSIVENYYSAYEPMEAIKIFNILEKLAEGGVETVFLTGGEPTLRKDLPEIVKETYRLDLLPLLSTNGENIDEIYAKRLKGSGLDKIQFSIEGPEKIHDEITRSFGGFKKSIKAAEILNRKGIKVIVSAVATKYNLPYIPELIDQIKNFTFGFRIIRLMTFSQHLLDLRPPPKYMTYYIETIKRCKEFGLKFIGGTVIPGLTIIRKPTLRHDPDEENVDTLCKAGKYMMTIAPDGSVSPCQIFKKDFVAGNILKQNVEEIWNGEVMRKFGELNPDKYKDQCGKCKDKWKCYSCRAIAYNLTGDIYGDDISCYRITPCPT